MGDIGNRSGDITIDRNEVTEGADSIQKVMVQAQGAAESAKGAVTEAQSLAGSVPAKARYAGLPTACAAALAELAVIDYVSFGKGAKETLYTLVDLAEQADEETAKKIRQMIDNMNEACMDAKTLKELMYCRMYAGDYDAYLKHVKDVWDRSYDDTIPAEEIRKQKSLASLSWFGYDLTQICSKDPVNLGNGNFIYDRTDMELKGTFEFALKRYYNAQSPAVGDFGQGWRHSFEERLIYRDDIYIYVHADGLEEPFYRKDDGEQVSVLAVGNILAVGKDECILQKTGDGEEITFDEEGRILRKTWENGENICMSYQDGKLMQVMASDGRSFAFFRDGEGCLSKIKDHTGRSLHYAYDEEKRLIRAEMADGAAYSYGYDERGEITEIVNPRGVRTVKNVYDEKGRVVRQDFPDGGFMTYAYDEEKRETELFERNGSRITYRHDELGRHIETRDDAGITKYTYNRHNRKSSHTDRRGNTSRYLYDDKGNLTAVVNPLGSRTCFTYDSRNHLTVVKDALGAKVTRRYDTKGRIIEAEDALGNRTLISYNEKGYQEKIVFPDGTGMSMEYDDRGNVTCIVRADGSRWRYRYDALNRVTESTDGNGNRTEYVYDERDRLILVRDADGRERSYAYNKSGSVESIVDFDGNRIRYEYNALNRPVRITDKEGNVTTYEYDRMWNISRMELSDGAKTGYVYDGMERLIGVELPNGGRIRYEYDADGNRTAETDPMGNRTEYTYDKANRLIMITAPDGVKIRYGYDKADRLVYEEDDEGNRISYAYDCMGRKISETDVMGNETLYEYDAVSNLIGIRYPDGTEEKREYNGIGLPVKITAGAMKRIYRYDGNGNITETENNTGLVIRYAYDSRNRITKIIGPDGGERTYDYDVMDRVTRMQDENGNETFYSYSPNGNLLSVTDAMGMRAHYEYDRAGRLTAVYRENGKGERIRQNTYVYDLMGLPKEILDAENQKERYEYDLNGRLVQKTDREGYATAYTYGADGQVSGIRYADEKSVFYEYDALRRLKTVKDWNGEIHIETDAAGRALLVTDAAGETVSYAYDKAGRKTSLTYPNGMKASYEYDERGMLTALVQGEKRVTYGYDEPGRLVRKSFPNGAETTYRYDKIGRLSELIHSDAEGILDAYRYTYDPAGNKTGITKQRRGIPEESGAYRYAYDALNRLCGVEKDGQLLRSYEYDAFGNRVRMEQGNHPVSYAYNALNQLVGMTDGMDEETYMYDKRGNLTEIRRNGELKNRYTYGVLNRLEEAWNEKGEAAAYSYNGLGHRIGKQISMNEEVLPERQIKDVLDLTRQYHNLLQRKDGENNQTFLWDGNVAGMETNGSMKYYLQDELGSPNRLTGQDGLLEESYAFDEFGEERIYAGVSGEAVSGRAYGSIQPFTYTGYRRDTITGTYYAQAREYRPQSGRFAARDIVKGYAAAPYTLNEYGYCWGNPMILVDMDGKIPKIKFRISFGEEIDNLIKLVKICASCYKVYSTVIYENGLIANPPNAFPTETEGIPDYTEMVDEWLVKKQQEFSCLKSVDGFGVGAGGASVFFYDQVKTNGVMDIKNRQRWDENFPVEQPKYLIYHGQVMDPATLGNITYGYIGSSLFPDKILYYGGGFANMKERGGLLLTPSIFGLPNYGDAPEDIKAIKIGIDMRKKGIDKYVIGKDDLCAQNN